MELAATALRKDMGKVLVKMLILLPHIFPVRLAGVEAQSQGREVCIGVNNQSYYCETGHCCGESQCCNYYYELWWFWLVWTIIIILSCCCVCHHRRAKLRLQQQQRQHEINLIAYQGARNYSLLPLYLRFLPSYLLPPYEEVVNRPVTPPPPYSAFHQQCVAACNGSANNPEPARAPATPSNLVPTVCEALPREGGNGAPDPDSPLGCPQRGSDKTPPTANRVAGEEEEHQRAASTECGSVRTCRLDLEKEEEEEEGEEDDELGCPEKERLADYYPGSSSKIENWHHHSCLEIKEVDKTTTGRHRRFTGDSGIEVCVCNRDDDDDEEDDCGREGSEERDGLIDGLGDAREFCDSCNVCDPCPRPDTREEAFAGAREQQQDCKEQQRAHGDVAAEEPVCLLLDTINENELPPAHQHRDSPT
uniref:WW domain binding protein 1-like a n=1 Tax=Pristiophorus japonicus TaxID=55135 RepID=UPI00398E8EF5